MSDFKPMTECKGFNMERVLLKNKNGYMITAYFKDGMLQCDGDEDWTQPIAWKGFIRLHDSAIGAPTKDSGLHLQRASESAITEIDKRTHDYNQKIDVVGNTNEQNITAEAKRDALDEALSIIRKHSR